jgi:hypothetical protein
LLALTTPSSKFRNCKSEKEIPPISHSIAHKETETKGKVAKVAPKWRRETKVNNLSAMALQRAAAHQIRRVEAHRRPPLRLGVPRHCTARSRAHRAISKCPRIPRTPRERVPDEERGEREASPSVSRSVSRRWRRRSRRELTDAVAAACFSLSSATDAMGAARC